MESPTDLLENLSDDYEEGEILEDDNLYDDVSSLEEFNSSEECGRSEVDINTSEIERDDPASSEKFKQCTKHRRKDHKCKENSVCRKERKGKHCYARIRKAKSYSKVKTVAETSPQSTVERIFPRKPDVTPIVKHLKCRPTSPYKTRPDPLPKTLHRYDYKDYHEKENRHNNKRYWATPPRSKLKPPENHAHYNRSKVTKDNHCSKSRHQALTPPKLSTNDTSKSDPISKTSLLKRLVGSGASGVKPIKDNESLTDLPKSETEEISPKASDNNDEADNLSNEKVETDEYQKSEPPKKIEVKWIRSMKEDKDELHLRVEALRSAWIKKFNDRKKKGLIHHKKSDDIDDFLEDFAFGSDIEDEKTDDKSASKSRDVAAESNALPQYNATDISGDILKTEDMVIVNDKTTEETIICETAVGATEGFSSIFVDPLFFSSGNFSQNVNVCQVSDSNCINFSMNESNSKINTITAPENSWKHSVEEHNAEIGISYDSHTLTENCSNGNSSRLRSKKIKCRKKRKSKGSIIEVGKSTANISADLDENVLRELALLSVKSKKRNIMNIAENKKDSENLDKNSTILLREPQVETTSSLCISGNDDNWEDDMDEDILRAQLLSSLTKQVSEESAKLERATAIAEESLQKDILVKSKILKSTVNSVKPPTSKKQTTKKLDRRKLKNSVNKKVWKQGNATIRKNTLEDNITVFGKSNVFNRNDKKTIHVQQNNTLSNVPPIPQVPQMIITVDDSDSSSDLDTSTIEPLNPLPKTEPIPADIEANIDLLLQQAIINSQLEKGVINSNSNSKPDDKEDKNKLQGNESVKPVDYLVSTSETKQTETKNHYVATPTSTTSSSSCSFPTPQALKHLPAWQQEEYKRLKKKIAEKEKVLQVTRSKIIDPSKDINANNATEGKSFGTKQMSSHLNSSKALFSSLHKDFSVLSSSTDFEKISTRSVDMSDNSTSMEHSYISEALKNSKVEVSKSSKIEKICSTEENNAAKKCLLMSCSIMEEINVMNDIVNDFEKNNSEYMDLIQKTNRLKRILKATESKMAVKKKKMFQIRDTISEKERQISSKISTFSAYNSSTPNEKTKPPNRDVELVKLKHKEVCLRAQFLFHDFLSEKVTGKDNDKKVNDDVSKQDSKSKEILPTGVKRMLSSKETIPIQKKITVKDSIVAKSVFNPEKAKDHIEAPQKRNFSGKEREREEWDPNTPVCHYDLNGICRDEECQYQHFKTV